MSFTAYEETPGEPKTMSSTANKEQSKKSNGKVSTFDKGTEKKPRLWPSYRLLVNVCSMLVLSASFSVQSSMSSAFTCMGTDRHDSPWVAVVNTSNTSTLFNPIAFLRQEILAIPAAVMGLTYLYINRFLAGVLTGPLAACVLGIAGKWAPFQERGVLFAIIGTGCEIGNFFSYAISSVSCGSNIQGGWPFVFYVTGSFVLGISTLIFFFVCDEPTDNTRIGPAEKAYLMSSRSNDGKGRIPMRTMFRSMSVWAAASSKLGFDFLFFFVLTQLPLFLEDVLKFLPFQVSVVTGIPFLLVIPSVFVGGAVSDLLITKGILSTVNVRRLDDAISKIIPSACLIGLSFVPEASVVVAFVLVTLTASTIGFGYLSSSATLADIGPNNVGSTYSFVATMTMWVSFVIPMMVEALTKQKTRGQWQNTMYVTAVWSLLTFLFYIIFISADPIQPLDEKGDEEGAIETESGKGSRQDDPTARSVKGDYFSDRLQSSVNFVSRWQMEYMDEKTPLICNRP